MPPHSPSTGRLFVGQHHHPLWGTLHCPALGYIISRTGAGQEHQVVPKDPGGQNSLNSGKVKSVHTSHTAPVSSG